MLTKLLIQNSDTMFFVKYYHKFSMKWGALVRTKIDNYIFNYDSRIKAR